jgi:hypothetical protein
MVTYFIYIDIYKHYFYDLLKIQVTNYGSLEEMKKGNTWRHFFFIKRGMAPMRLRITFLPSEDHITSIKHWAPRISSKMATIDEFALKNIGLWYMVRNQPSRGIEEAKRTHLRFADWARSKIMQSKQKFYNPLIHVTCNKIVVVVTN